MWTLNRKSELTKMEAAVKDEALHIHPEEWEKTQAGEAAKAEKIIIVPRISRSMLPPLA